METIGAPRGSAHSSRRRMAIATCTALLILTAAAVSAQPYTFTHLAGTTGGPGSSDGPAGEARFSGAAVAVSPDGTVYVADAGNHTIRRIVPGGLVTTIAGIAGARGAQDGAGSQARFNFPTGIALAPDRSLYVADSNNHVIRRVDAEGMVTTYAGEPGSFGLADGARTSARFNSPFDVGVGPDGAVYVSDSGNCLVRAIAPNGTVRTLAGAAGACEHADGPASQARFRDPHGVAVGADGAVFVADAAAHAIRRITPAGLVTTLAGVPGTMGWQDGAGSQARFAFPRGVAVAADGSVYVADSSNHVIRHVTLAAL